MTVLTAEPFVIPRRVANHYGVTPADGWFLSAYRGSGPGPQFVQAFIIKDGPNHTIVGEVAATLFGFTNGGISDFDITTYASREAHTITSKVLFAKPGFAMNPAMIILGWAVVAQAFIWTINPDGTMTLNAQNGSRCFNR